MHLVDANKVCEMLLIILHGDAVWQKMLHTYQQHPSGPTAPSPVYATAFCAYCLCLAG